MTIPDLIRLLREAADKLESQCGNLPAATVSRRKGVNEQWRDNDTSACVDLLGNSEETASGGVSESLMREASREWSTLAAKPKHKRAMKRSSSRQDNSRQE